MPDESDVRSSPSHIEDFMDSVVWADMERHIKILLETARDGAEDTDDEVQWRRNQGRAEVCRIILALPQVMLDSLLADSELAEGEIE